MNLILVMKYFLDHIKTHNKNGTILEPVKTKNLFFQSKELALKHIADLKIKLTRIGYHQVFM